MADQKTWMDVLYVAVPPTITGLVTVVVAALLTRKTERERTQSQKDIETQRTDFQVILETQRQAFQRALEIEKIAMQREADAERHRRELYKSLFLERMAVAKKLSELVGTFFQKANSYYFRREADVTKDELERINVETFVFINSYHWLIGSDVFAATNNFRSAAIAVYTHEEKAGPLEMDVARERLSEAISSMMLNDDLERLVEKEKMS